MRPAGGRPDRLLSSSEYVRQPNPNVFISGLHVNPIDSNTWRAQKAELLRHVWIGYLHFAGCNGMLPLSATLCCRWRHSRCTIILPPSAIQSCHLIRRGSRLPNPAVRGGMATLVGATGSRCGWPVIQKLRDSFPTRRLISRNAFWSSHIGLDTVFSTRFRYLRGGH
jgi:hypothetical protein